MTTAHGFRPVTSGGMILVATENREPFAIPEHLACLPRGTVFGCVSREVWPGLPYRLPRPRRGQKNRTHPRIPRTLTRDLAWWLGATVGDGSYTDTRDGTIDFTNSDASMIRRWRSVVASLGLRSSCRRVRNIWRTYVVARALRGVLLDLGLAFVRAPEKRAPNGIDDAPAPVRAAFLQGLFDTDGSVGRGSVRFTTASLALARDVQRLLLSLGVVGFVSSQNERHHKVAVYGPSVRAFAEAVGFSMRSKQERLRKLLTSARAGKTNIDIVPYGASLMRQVLEILPVSKGRKGRGRNVDGRASGWLYNAAAGRIRTSYAHLRKARELLERNGLRCAALEETIAHNYFFDRIET